MAKASSDTIAFVGGGISGLSGALAVAQHGYRADVFDQRAVGEVDGAGIQIGPNGVRILRDLGVADLLKPHACQPERICVLEAASGRHISSLPLGTWIAERHGAPYWTCARADLHAALLHSAKQNEQICLRFETPVLAVTETPTHVVVSSSDQPDFHYSAALHAGGLWCKTTPTPSRRHTGKAAVRTLVDTRTLPKKYQGNETFIWLHPGAHVVHYPVNGGKQVALVVIHEDRTQPEAWDGPVDTKDMQSVSGPFCSDLKDLLNCATNWRAWPLFSQTDTTSDVWSTLRTTRIGDAGHPVLPFLAQGGVMALEDAVVLAKCLQRHRNDLPGAFQAFESLRQPRKTSVAKASIENGKAYHLSGLLAHARNTTLRVVPGDHFMKRYDWLYGWTPGNI